MPQSQSQKDWVLRNIAHVREYNRNWRRAHPQPYQKGGKRAWVQKQRRLVFEHYSNGTPKCVCCGEAKWEFLTLDHINNDGSKDRQLRGSSTNYYRSLIRDNYPPGYQVLCSNCNYAKAYYGKCPHVN